MASAEEHGLKWLKCPLDLWVPAGLADFQIGWFINLLKASLYSEYLGYLILCAEGCGGCPACLWKIAGAHRPDYFEKRKSLVMARFEFAQIAGHRVAYYPPLVATIKKQLARIRNHHSHYGDLSETSTEFNKGGGGGSPSNILSFDFDFDSKNQNQRAKGIEMNGRQDQGEDLHEPDNEFVEEIRTTQAARRILNILGLPEALLLAAKAAVETEARQTSLSMDGIVQSIVTDANHVERRGVTKGEFLEDYLARSSAKGILGRVNLPVSNNFVLRLAAVVKAEAKDTNLPVADAADRIAEAALADRDNGKKVDIFYFEDVRWRANVGTSKAEQRKRSNLVANARAKEILRRQVQ